MKNLNDTQFGTYWIVEISFRESNPRHISIGFAYGNGHWLLFNGGYEEIEKIHSPSLEKRGGYFRPIEQIKFAGLR